MDFDTLSESALSIRKAASDSPKAIAVITESEILTFSELRKHVEKRIPSLKRPLPGRPYVLTGDNTLGCFITLYALLEEKIPVLLLHPTLTTKERTDLLESIEAISTPLPKDVAVILFTSGTTGVPKPAMLSREALTASAYSSAKNIPLQKGDRWLMSLSVARIGGLSILTRSLIARSAIVIAPHFSAKSFTTLVDEKEITLASIVPTMLSKLLEEMPLWKPSPIFRAILLGGANATNSLLRRARLRGIPVITTYGMTETASNVVSTPYADRFNPEPSAKVNAFAQVEIFNHTIHIKGPIRMIGYWGGKSLEKDDWFDTGDIGYFDNDNNLHVEARRTDLIVTGGENVYPAEVESVLESLQAIRSALVVGLPDPTWGAIVTALLVPTKEPLANEKLTAELSSRLSVYKCPRRILWVKDLPTKPGGKLDRSPANLNSYPLITLHYKEK